MFYPMNVDVKFENGTRVKLRRNIIVELAMSSNSIGGYSKGHEFTVLESWADHPGGYESAQDHYYQVKSEKQVRNPKQDILMTLLDDEKRQIVIFENEVKAVKVKNTAPTETVEFQHPGTAKPVKAKEKKSKTKVNTEYSAKVIPLHRAS